MNGLNLPSTLDGIKKTIKQTNTGKAYGIDGPPAKIFQAAGSETMNTLHNILTST